jgi:hypothetical protein
VQREERLATLVIVADDRVHHPSAHDRDRRVVPQPPRVLRQAFEEGAYRGRVGRTCAADLDTDFVQHCFPDSFGDEHARLLWSS